MTWTSFLVPIVGLAGGPALQAAWHPLNRYIVNRTSQPQTLEVNHYGTDTVGYVFHGASGGAADVPRILEPYRELTIPGHSVVQLYVNRPAGAESKEAVETKAGLEFKGANLALALRGTRWGMFNVSLMVDPSGRPGRFLWGGRDFVQSPEQVVGVGPDAIVILDLPAAGKASSGESKADGKAASGGSLPAMDYVDREAGMHNFLGNYTVKYIRPAPAWGQLSGWGPLHAKGHLMPEEVMMDYFLNTLFSYNNKRFTGLEPGLNYNQYPGLDHFDKNYQTWLERICHPGGERMVDPPKPHGDFKAFITYKAALDHAIGAFRRNPGLVGLGIAYMRQKIVTEKLQAALPRQASGDQERVKQLLLARDRLTDTIQAMVFNWMDQGYKEFFKRYKAGSKDQHDAAGQFLEDFTPTFLEEPFYANIINNLQSYTQPTEELEGVKLSPN